MTYSKVEKYTIGNCIVTVRHPDLTDEERKIREREVERAAARILMEVIDLERAKLEANKQGDCLRK